MTIDLSREPPPRPGVPRRQFLLAALCGGLTGGATVLLLPSAEPPEVDAGTVAAVEPAETPEVFTDLETIGPVATVTIGRSGRCSVTVGATIVYGSSDNDVLSQGGSVSYEISGANRRPPSLDGAARSILSLSGVEVPFSVTQTFAATTVLDSLSPGETTFTAKYRTEGNSPVPVFFSNRTILVTTL